MNLDYTKIIGANIRFERQKRDLTIEELSEILNIAPGFLGLIERGQRGTSIKNLCKIAEFFSISLDDLITRSLSGNTEMFEDDSTPKQLKNSTASSLIHNLDVDELDFVIAMIKNVKKLTKSRDKDSIINGEEN